MRKIPYLADLDKPDCFGDEGHDECTGCWIAMRVLKTTKLENLRMTIRGISYGKQRRFVSKCNKEWHRQVKETYGVAVCESVYQWLTVYKMTQREVETSDSNICLN